MRKILTALLIVVLGSYHAGAQTQKHYSSTAIYNKIQKLNFLGTVLYVGAHPDDENTALISYLSNDIHARVAYLAMTRGDGGQNLIGPEIRELLGVIRTEELLAARRVDRGKQFFTRANDFGFSKNPEETFQMWDRQKVLSDVVWMIRKFRPDVIVNRFDRHSGGETHGHHTASAILSYNAFKLSGKKDKFPQQLRYYPTWQPQKLYCNISWLRFGHKKKWKKLDKSKFLKIDLGPYLPLKGWSNTEISALSRSQHRSQGFGRLGSRGKDIDYFQRVEGQFPQDDKALFSGINTTWSRVKGGKAIGKILYQVQADYNFKNPAASIPGLLKAYQLIKKLPNKHWRKIKTKQIKEIIGACAGLYLQASTLTEFDTPGQKLKVELEAINRSKTKITLSHISLNAQDYRVEKSLKNNRDFKETASFSIPGDADYTTPYWLRLPHTMQMYRVKKQPLIGLPETPPQFVATFHTTVNGVPVNFKRTLIYRTAKPAKGIVEEPFDIVPKVSVAMQNKTLIFADDNPKPVKVKVKAYKDAVSGRLHLVVPKGWQVSPKEIKIDLEKKGKEKTLTFTVTPPHSQAQGHIHPAFAVNGKSYEKQVHVIAYPHIPTQTVLMPTRTKVLRLNIKTRGKNIAYLRGSGDEIPKSLREIGYKVTVLSGKNMSLEQLKKYDAVVIGIRAYNTNKYLAINQPVLFDYIKQGGTVITQYNKSYHLKTKKVAPYPLTLSHDRVTDENSKVKFLAPKNPVLNFPNKITQKDFKGWTQERGLYFPRKWSKKYTPILGMHDKGEKEMKGSLLVAPYGKGYFVYTGLSFFRELPAGVAGAYRLFANLLALGN